MLFRTSQAAPLRLFAFVVAAYVLLSAAVLVAVTTTVKPWRYGGDSIYGQTFLVGSTTRSLVQGRGMVDCTDAMGTPGNAICYHGARMPVASGTLALGVLLLGDHPRPIVYAKNMLYLVPLWLACGVVLWRARGSTKLLLCAALLFLPLLMLNYTGTVVNVDAEEGYLFGLLGLAVALVLTASRPRTGWLLAFGATLNALYLCKSSLLAVCVVLGCAGVLRLRTPLQRIALLVLLCLAPLGWGVRQYHASGRFSVGTSLDGLNLQKGNNARFLSRYPGANGVLDQYDDELNQGVRFSNEWQFNDYHLRQAKLFIWQHPGYTARSVIRKAVFLLLTLDRHARLKSGLAATMAIESGFVLFRLLLWTSLVVAVYAAAAGRFHGVVYLAFVAAYLMPYLAGFGYMRHVIMLALPAVIFLACALQRRGLAHPHTANPEADRKV